jgi:hypothetical protein
VDDGIDGTIGIPAVPRHRKLSEFRSKPFCRGKKTLGILYCGTKIEANFRNSVPNHSAEEKKLGPIIETKFRNSVPKHFAAKT